MRQRQSHTSAKPQADDPIVVRCRASRLRFRGPRRGAVAVAAVVLMIMVSLIIVGMVLVGARHQDLSVNTIEATRAFYGAEAAMNLSLRELSLDEDIDGSGDVGGIAPIAPPAFRGITAGVEIENAGDFSTLAAWAETTRVHRRNELTATQQSSTGGTGYPGLLAYYHIVGQPLWSVDHVDWSATPDAAAVTPNIDWPSTSNSNPFWIGGPNNNYGARFVGWVNIPESGTWTFETISDDGSILSINGEEVVDNDGLHGMRQRSGTIDLDDGWHEIEVLYFENGGNHGLIVRWDGPGIAQRTVIPPEAFAHTDGQRLQPVAGVAARETMNMLNQTVIDAFDSSVGEYGGSNVLTDAAYIAVNSTANGAINMWGGGTIYGHARVGPGGEPDTGIVPANANITGTRAAFDSEVTVPQIILPDGIPNSAGSFSLERNQSETFSSNFRYSSFSLENNASITVTEPIVGRIDGNFSMRNNSRIDLTGKGRLTLYVYGSLSMRNNTKFNDNTGDPSRVRIVMMDGNSSADLSNGARIVGSVVAPEGLVNLTNQSEIVGSVFCRTLSMNGDGAIHVDRRTVPIDGGGQSGLLVHSWSEAGPSP